MRTLFALTFALLMIGFASAGVEVTYEAFYAEIESDAAIDYSDVSIEGFSSVGYVCTSENCSTVGSKVAGLTKSTDTNSITLTYPANLASEYGYGIWFYKAGYIHWEHLDKSYGNLVVDDAQNVFFLKKELGLAPILDLNVINEVRPNLPVEVGVSVGIDADTHSALENAGPLVYNPSELESLNIVETLVGLRIIDSGSRVIHEENQTISIPYSSSEEVSYTYPGFEEAGEYEIEVYTEVIDVKILESIRQDSLAEIIVIPEGLTDYSYALLNGLDMNPVHPQEREQIDFSFDYSSYYVNNFGVLTSLNTTVLVEVFQGSGLDNSFEYELEGSGTFSFSQNFNDDDDYRVVITGTPTNGHGANGTIESVREISFRVSEEDSGNSGSRGSTGSRDINDFIVFNDTLSKSSNSNLLEYDDSVVQLSIGERQGSTKELVYWLTGLLILLILLILVFILKRI